MDHGLSDDGVRSQSEGIKGLLVPSIPPSVGSYSTVVSLVGFGSEFGLSVHI